MTSIAPAMGRPAEAPATETDLALMARSGIVRTETFSYRVGDYRSSNLRDALAQAARTAGVKEQGA